MNVDLSLLWAHMSEGMCLHVAAQIAVKRYSKNIKGITVARIGKTNDHCLIFIRNKKHLFKKLISAE